MRKNGHYDKENDKDNIEIYVNTNTLKSEMILKNNYEVDFGQDKTINSRLGFHSKLYTSIVNESENMENILTINSKLVIIDIISGSYVNGFTQPTIYSFFPDVSHGHKIIENSYNLPTLPITAYTIHTSTLWLIDENENELNLRGEKCQCDFICKRFEKISLVLK